MYNRRQFLTAVSMFAAGTAIGHPLREAILSEGSKLQIMLIGTGVRGNSFWGRRLLKEYGDLLEFTALVDHNPGRLNYAAEYIGVGESCELFGSFEEAIQNRRVDLVIVTTTDASHDEYIIKALESEIDVLTEKPMTTDEIKCQAILDAEKKSTKKVIVGFNYRWSPYSTKIKHMLSDGAIGDLVSVDFSWMLNTSHGASYFRRWHGEMKHSGSLLVHKSTHHFDLLNWWLDADPQEIFAYGDLEFYGNRPEKKGVSCRTCDEKSSCKFYWDITRSLGDYQRYVKHEQYDGYIRDNCLFRPEIDIYDKMNVMIKYANNVQVNYMLTTYSPWEGWRIAFNGTKGRIEAFLDVPYLNEDNLTQEQLHAAEMDQGTNKDQRLKPIIYHQLWNDYTTVNVPYSRGGHGGGDARLHDRLFKEPHAEDIYQHMAGTRDGAMSILIGVAARKSIESGTPVQIADLTNLEPSKNRG